MHPTAMQTKPTSALPNFTRANMVPDFITAQQTYAMRDGVVITISRAATRPKSEKPRSSREGKRSKRLKRQQQERKEKYRKRQCRANHEQQHQLSKLRATHDVQHQHSGARNLSRWGLPHAPNPTPRKGATAIVLRIRLGRYCGISSKNNSAIAPNPLPPRASPPEHPGSST